MRQLKVTQQEKMQIEAELKTMQSAARDHASLVTEIDDLHESRREQLEAMKTKNSKIAELEKALTQSDHDKRNLRTLCEQQQADILQHPSALEALRQEIEDEHHKERSNAKSAVLTARNDIQALAKDKEALQQQLEECQDKEARLSKEHAALSADRETLRTENSELQIAQQASADQILRVERDHDRKGREHEQSLEELQRKFEQADAALKEAQATLKRQEAEFRKKLDFECKKFESKIETLLVELEKSKATMATIEHQQQARQETQQHTAQSHNRDENFVSSLHDARVGNKRKKVNRHSKPVEDLDSASAALNEQRVRPAAESREQRHYTEQDQMLFGNQPQGVGDYAECSIREPVAQQVDETQQIPGMTFTFPDITRNLGSDDESPLSDVPSDDLDQLQETIRDLLPAGLSWHDSHSNGQPVSRTREAETRQRDEEGPNSDSYSTGSRDRPRSQANMASRMMPPPRKTSQRYAHRKSDGSVPQQAPGSVSIVKQHGYSTMRHRDSSPDFMHHPSSVMKHTNAESDQNTVSRNEQVSDSRELPGLVSSRKRRNPDDSSETTKKVRTSSISLQNPFYSTQPDVPRASKPRAEASRSRSSKSSSHGLMLLTRSQDESRSSSVAPDTPTPSRSSQRGVASRSRNGHFSTTRFSVAEHRRNSGSQPASSSSRQTRSRS
ncbi:hypothetical protein FB567DRAFT_189351 [Paraphoma chrysanthemicola]|uniref:Uncharacterized protein n=1 Tax=Paraphoma chrysanthemicola TaxID=798071 RepID=A0A8K0VTF6_9PLEO|nr:hypothetical protein FB567DRAFT_189351 [Paraphoma chrysanthemicola]